MQNWRNAACTVRSTIFVVILLVATLLLCDYYKWRRLSLPWYASSTLDVFDAPILAPPSNGETAGQYSVEKGPADSLGTQNTLAPFATPSLQTDNSNPATQTPIAQSSPTMENPTTVPALTTSPSQPSPDVPVAVPPTDPHVKKSAPKLSSLQKLEAGLGHARSAIRKAVVGGIDSTKPGGQGSDYEPFGDVYRNAATFRQSYWEMEKRFKVFAYPEGEEPLVHNGPCKEIYAIEGRFIQELQGDNPFLTTDTTEAHVFFLPFSVAMMVTYLYEDETQDIHPLQHFVKDYVDVVMQKYPFWNRSGGADHFMLSCHDWGPAVTNVNPDLAKSSIRVLCNANTSEGYVPWKDASLPEINLIGGRIPTKLGGAPANERPYLAFFAGGDHGPVRPHLFRYWEGKDEDVKVYRSLPAGLDYHELMKKSRFCICPGGYEVNSPRIVEAIYNDCVPVVIADKFVLPFSDVLNWSSFSIHVNESEIPNLKEILQAISIETYVSMQEQVKQVRLHFLLNQPPERYDVFHMILHSVWLRRLNIRINTL